jgi:NAD(P)-dependent dehydrogenase (short-subunit alcohol dehydrogenase family)
MEHTAAVAGGAGAIGGAIVGALSDDGHRVIVLDRKAADQAQRGDADAVAVELADAEAVAQAARQIASCDVYVHAAAAFDRFELAEFDLVKWRRVQAVNVEAALLLARAFAPGMATKGFGRMIFITSNTVLRPPRPELLPYIASKAALEGVVRTLALEVGPFGITVNAVAPGLTRTPSAEAGMPPEVFEAVRARQAIPRTLEPPDIAGAVAFLASDRAAAITGQTICVDGGLVFR